MNLLLVFLLAQQAIVSHEEMFRRAAELYDEGSFAEAAEQYESLRSSGITDGVLFYNLGNTYFKSGQLGPAILNYERALRLLPGDEDVKANLAFANELITDVVEPPDLPSFIVWMFELYGALDPGFCAGLLSLSFLLGGMAVSLLILGRWPQLRTPLIYFLTAASLVALVSASVLTAKVSFASREVRAIVLVSNSDVRSGPGETNPQLTEIHEGLGVMIMGDRQGWLQVRLPNGLTGWIREGDVEVI